MRFQSYFNTAVKIIQLYDGIIPLHHFLKQYFSQHKKYGSRDRKFISGLCYNFYRTGKALDNLSAEEKLKTAVFLCNNFPGSWDFLYTADWLNNWSKALQQRIAFVEAKCTSFTLKDVFPYTNKVSADLNVTAFTQSFFVQPDVFVRIRPGYNQAVIRQLEHNKIVYDLTETACLALPPSTEIGSIIKINEEAVIQDYSSQKIKRFFEPIGDGISNLKSPVNVWDCCAGSGGKSILAYDILENINLTVSDVRPSIIQNLKQRFAKAGIKKYKSLVLDATLPLPETFFSGDKKGFDLIICDAPCSGSGTWSRTPEQLYFFRQEKINDYALLQQRIVSNTIPLLNNNGFFLYVTCSVFAKENEETVEFITRQFHLDLLNSKLLKGYNNKADTLFAALFKKKNYTG